MNDFQKIFEKKYKMLNPEQKKAVDTIEGPVLVIAGPGTGKTQLLSTRIANILQKTDTSPENILAMTFTEAGARNMRERLSQFIGTDSYKIGIFTYHGFANEIINNYREYFLDKDLDSLADDLNIFKILESLKNNLDDSSRLKKDNISSLTTAISHAKQALITPEMLAKIAKQNVELDKKLLKKLDEEEIDFSVLEEKGISKKTVFPEFYENLLITLAEVLKDITPAHPKVKPNLFYTFEALEKLLEENKNAEKFSTKPFTSFRNDFFGIKNEKGRLPKDFYTNLKIQEFADFYKKYEEALHSKGMFDYNDMILETIKTIEQKTELKLSLQEKYQFILLDEYQDTNAAQSRLVELLTDNEIFNGRPNILAVGDDDQAIMAFQGAKSSNMLDFYHRYKDTEVINLRINYRSRSEILYSAKNIAEQIESRLSENLPTRIDKNIEAFDDSKFESPYLVRKDFLSQISEFGWIADEISNLIKSGVSPKEIAVLAPKHNPLQMLAPYLKRQEIAVSYEKKENIFEDEIISSLIKISQLIIAISDNNLDKINALFPEILSFNFWKLNPVEIWKLSWKINSKRETVNSWLPESLFCEDKNISQIVEFIISLSQKIDSYSLESILDVLLGSVKWNFKKGETVENPSQNDASEIFESPIRKLFSQDSNEGYYDTLSNLIVLRENLREFTREHSNSLRDLVAFAEDYENAGMRIINTNPHKATDDAVQLMTAFQAKGLEFSHVFMIDTNNRVWNGKNNNFQSVRFPKNLEFIPISDEGKDTKLRLLFVAITRAKTHLYMTNHLMSFSGEKNTRLEFFDEHEKETEDEKFFVASFLPEKFQKIELEENDAKELDIQTSWHDFYRPKNDSMRDLLKNRLENYAISATHLNNFIDVEYGGPINFFENIILRFPQGYSINSIAGNLAHNAFRKAQNELNQNGFFDSQNIIRGLEKDISKYVLTNEDRAKILKTAAESVEKIFSTKSKLFQKGNRAEENFHSKGIMLGNAHLTGTVDLLIIDKNNKEITILDWKTGSIPLDSKDRSKIVVNSKIYKYEQQLFFYKFMVENSKEFSGYKVKSGILQFVQPNADGDIASHSIDFETPANKLRAEFTDLLIQAVFEKIKKFDFDDDISKFSEENLKGIKKFESQLVKEFAISHNLKEVPLYKKVKRGSSHIFTLTKTILEDF